MSHYRDRPFKISMSPQGAWVVDFDGKGAPVNSRGEAILLADLPVQLYRAVSKDRKPDFHRVRLILALCDEYHLGRVRGVRQLKSWYKRNGR